MSSVRRPHGKLNIGDPCITNAWNQREIGIPCYNNVVKITVIGDKSHNISGK